MRALIRFRTVNRYVEQREKQYKQVYFQRGFLSIGGRPLNMLSVQIGILQTIWKFFIRVFNLLTA